MHRTFARIVSYAIAGGDLSLAQEQTAAHDRVIPQTFGSVLRRTLATQNPSRSHRTERRVRPRHAASCNAPT